VDRLSEAQDAAEGIFTTAEKKQICKEKISEIINNKKYYYSPTITTVDGRHVKLARKFSAQQVFVE